MDSAEQIRQRLTAREAELRSALTRHGAESLEAGATEVQDEIDVVTSLEAKTAALELSTIEFKGLSDVRAALQRLEAGTYGLCVLCEEPIGEARLRAIPETPYCLRDAEAAEAEQETNPADL